MYRTSSLTFAAYLMSSRQLKLSGVEGPEGNTRIVYFLFEDPAGKGNDLYTEFLSGPCSAFYESLKSLRKMIDARTPSRYSTIR